MTQEASKHQSPEHLNTPISILQLQNGDPAAFRELVDQYRDRVYNTVLGFLQHREDAEDVLQDVFVEVYQSIGRFRETASLSTWIYRIAVQKALEHIRNSKRKKRSGIILSLFGRENQVPVTSAAPFYHPGIKLENKERAAILFGAIGRLPENQRIAFTLHKIESLSYAEIAEIMKVSISAVESLMFRANQNLRKMLSDYYNKNEQ
jgi:RNA polymerase sigma-70 factor (ECF subfamily)